MNWWKARPTWQKVALVLLLVVVVLAAVADSPQLTIAAVDSGVESVPIPETAQELELAGETAAWEVPGMDFGELVEWYDREMPPGEGHAEWEWCEANSGAEFDQRTYFRGEEILTVVVNADEPASLLVGHDDFGGPC